MLIGTAIQLFAVLGFTAGLIGHIRGIKKWWSGSTWYGALWAILITGTVLAANNI
jgi:hypothetical protein